MGMTNKHEEITGEEVGDLENIERMDTKKGSDIEGLT